METPLLLDVTRMNLRPHVTSHVTDDRVPRQTSTLHFNDPAMRRRRKTTKELWDTLRAAVLDGTFNENNTWKRLTSKTFLSRLAREKYLEEV